MTVKEICSGLKYEIICGNDSEEITSLVYDSRKIEEGCVFVCIKGANFDGHDAAGEAMEKHASAIIISHEIPIPRGYMGTVVKVEDTRYALAFLSANYFGNPADKMKVIGITGTKGKTTTTYLVKSILEQAGMKTGLVGTIETIIGEEHIPAKNTTPESYILQESFAKMVEEGCDCVVMEVSSQGLMMHRTQGFMFDFGIFTNIEPDHIGPDEHESFEDYMACKALLFKQCKTGILNGDDAHVKDLLKGHTCDVKLFGFKDGLDYQASGIELYRTGGELGVKFQVKGQRNIEVAVPTPGKFSVYNALTALAICDQLGKTGLKEITDKEIQSALAKAHVKGRIEMIKVSPDFSLMIDYAHNAMALESLLSTLKEYKPDRLVCLFGCGGNRSKLRRYEMGEVSGKLADLTIITSDNPRFEKPLDIIADIRTGIEKTRGKYVEIPDRKEAIRYAIKNGQKGDIIVLAGKGHEDYQEIEGKKYPMDERVLIEEVLVEEGLK